MPIRVVEQWCEHHDAALMETGANGFFYMIYNGTMWYMSYERLEADGA